MQETLHNVEYRIDHLKNTTQFKIRSFKIEIFYSSWKIHHNTDATAEWKSEFLAQRIKALLCFTRKQISASFLGVYLLSMAAGNALALVNF